MLEFNFTPFPDLTTERLHLRRVTTDDAPALFWLRSSEQVMQYIGRPRAKSIEDALELIQRYDDGLATKETINWGITLRDSPGLIGMIGYVRSNRPNHRAELGYMLHPDFHRQGIMHEAAKAVIAYGFEGMKLHSIEATIAPENQASQKLLEKNGFVREAYFREDYYFNGQFLDSAIYSLLGRDYSAV
jgi:ribosomal-protein-alanine N-acetyltransferase